MAENSTTFERVELKYWLESWQIEPLQKLTQQLMVPDLAGNELNQRNVSLYLETPNFTFLKNHEAGLPDRLKLRVRRYGNSDKSGTVFCEIKRKVKNVILKSRARIAGTDLDDVLLGVRTPETKDPAHLEQFMFHQLLTRAQPKVIVSCDRMAFKAEDPLDSARLTIDSNIAYQPWRGEFFNISRAHDVAIDGVASHGRNRRCALLELKFMNRAPVWMAELIGRFGLERTAYSKFCSAIRMEFGMRYYAVERDRVSLVNVAANE
jgi:VTC domain